MKFFTLINIIFLIFSIENSHAVSLISGISNNEINVDTDFKGTQILLFGAKSDSGNVVINVRGPRKNFIVSKKENIMGIWYNGDRVEFKDAYSFYSLFSTFHRGELIESDLSDFELGKNNIKFETIKTLSPKKTNEFRLQLVELLEKGKYYDANSKKIDFLDETLFKIIIDFPKNILLGTYVIEIYLVNNGTIISYQAIPVYVNQVGFSAQVSNFATNQSFIYGLIAVFTAVLVGFITNYLFARFLKK